MQIMLIYFGYSGKDVNDRVSSCVFTHLCEVVACPDSNMLHRMALAFSVFRISFSTDHAWNVGYNMFCLVLHSNIKTSI